MAAISSGCIDNIIILVSFLLHLFIVALVALPERISSEGERERWREAEREAGECAPDNMHA